MGRSAAIQIVTAFTNAITNGDVAAMTALMSEDHTFTDSREHAVVGRAAVRAVWEHFFERQPGYAVHIDSTVVRGDEVFLTGHSDGNHPGLCGHALWRALIRDGKIAAWQVYRQAGVSRADLGLLDDGMIASLEPLFSGDNA